jgi:hypothetical protein
LLHASCSSFDLDCETFTSVYDQLTEVVKGAQADQPEHMRSCQELQYTNTSSTREYICSGHYGGLLHGSAHKFSRTVPAVTTHLPSGLDKRSKQAAEHHQQQPLTGGVEETFSCFDTMDTMDTCQLPQELGQTKHADSIAT